MEALILTNEYPPNVYGGAGVHVDYLTRELALLMRVDVRTFGEQDEASGQLTVRGFPPSMDLSEAPEWLRPVIGAFSRNLAWAAEPVTADVVHCHTWYAQFGGIVVKQAYGLPLVITTHSLEPLRPWKREQLKGGYDLSAWVERTAIQMADAVIAVSKGTREDVIRLFDVAPERVHVIHNGIDTNDYAPTDETEALDRFRVDKAKPYVLFVGRITRQKGIIHLVHAIQYLDRDTQVVLCAGAPDTPEIGAEMEAAIAAVEPDHPNVVWIPQTVDKPSIRQLYSHATVFCCPSVYEPFGIINLEAMACETAVVASAVGGIPEVVVDGETGILVPFEATVGDDTFAPRDPKRYEQDLAKSISELMADPQRAREMGRAGRLRAIDQFSWTKIAKQTAELYGSLVEAAKSGT